MITKSSALTVNLSMAMWKEAGISEAKEEVGSVDRWLEGMWAIFGKDVHPRFEPLEVVDEYDECMKRTRVSTLEDIKCFFTSFFCKKINLSTSHIKTYW